MKAQVLLLLLALIAWPSAAQSGAPFLVEAAFDVTWAYPGQAVLYTVTAYSDTARDVSFTMPAFEGFWQAEARAFTGGAATVNGKQYSTSIYQVSLYPQRPGLLSVSPASVTFAETVFSDGEVRLSTLTTLEVLPLPPAPDGFSGLVGVVDVHFSAEPDIVAIGEPIELTLRLQGAANLAQYSPAMPEMPDGWRLYPAPRNSDTAFDGDTLIQAKIIRWRAIPDRAGRATVTLPPIIIFTPAAGYETLTIAPLEFEVLPGANGELSREGVTETVQSLLIPAQAQAATRGVPVLLWLAAPLTALAAFIGRAGARRWRHTRAEARKRNAFQVATGRLRAIVRDDGDLTAIAAAVHGYFSDSQRDISTHSDALHVLTEIESQRYNPQGEQQRTLLARRAAELLKHIEGVQ